MFCWFKLLTKVDYLVTNNLHSLVTSYIFTSYLITTKSLKKMNNAEKQQLDGFNAAKQIALTIGNGLMRRAKVNNIPVNYCGARLNNRMWVIADNNNDLQNPDAVINGKPAREIFGDFTVMAR
jgi:hypothetical protein